MCARSHTHTPCFCSQLTAQPRISCSILPISAASPCSPIRFTSGNVKSLMCCPRTYTHKRLLLQQAVKKKPRRNDHVLFCLRVRETRRRTVRAISFCHFASVHHNKLSALIRGVSHWGQRIKYIPYSFVSLSNYFWVSENGAFFVKLAVIPKWFTGT